MSRAAKSETRRGIRQPTQAGARAFSSRKEFRLHRRSSGLFQSCFLVPQNSFQKRTNVWHLCQSHPSNCSDHPGPVLFFDGAG